MIELHILAPQDQVESLSDVLLELSALSVSVEDADAPHGARASALWRARHATTCQFLDSLQSHGLV